MYQILLTGCGGRMGKEIARICSESPSFSICAGVDPAKPECSFPVYDSIGEVREKADVIIDFSFHTAVGAILDFAIERGIPAVIATTGHSPDETALIQKAAERIRIFKSANMSIGVNLICELCKKAAKLLPDFDIEIVEQHHNQKIDAPSGTALMIADDISSVLPEKMNYVFDRHSVYKKREQNEIGIHSVRGGSIVGEHQVIFAGNNETVTISHSAYSREILANGAVCAAKYILELKKSNGLFNMKNMLGD